MVAKGDREINNASRVLFTILLVLAFFASFAPVNDPDVWWHIRTGDYILEHKSIPSVDVYSHTVSGQEWITHEWLSQIILYLTYHLGGALGIKLLNSLFAVLAMAALWRFYRKANVQLLITVFALMMIFPDFLGRLRFRPDIFSLVFTVLIADFLIHLDRTRLPTRRQIIGLALLAALWGNLHSISLIGLLLLVAFTGGELLTLLAKRWLDLPEWKDVTFKSFFGLTVLTIAYGIGVMANPNLFHVYSYLFLGSKYLPGELGIMEWQSPFAFLLSILHRFLVSNFRDISLPLTFQFIYLIIPLGFLASLPVLAKKRALPGLSVIVLCIVAIYVSAGAVRFRWLFFIPVYYLALGLSYSLPRKGEEARPVRYAALASLPFMMLVIGASLYLQLSSPISLRKQVDLRDYPRGICNFLTDAKIGGKIFNPYNWGGYLIFRLTPEYKVFIDGRTILYSTASRNILLDHVVIDQKLEGYDRLLEDYGVQVLLAKGKIYFPGKELQEEWEFNRERLRKARRTTSPIFTDESSKARKKVSAGPGSGEGVSDADWTLLMVNREGSIYLDRLSADSLQMARCEDYFKKQGLSFSWEKGLDVAGLIVKRPDLALRFNIIPEQCVEKSELFATAPESDEALDLALDLAEACFKIGFVRDAADLYDGILEVRRYDYKAFYGGAFAHHILGENEIAFAYLEKLVTFAKGYPAMSLLEHCREHRPLPSKMKRKLPEPSELARLWKTNSRLSKTISQ